MTRLLLILAFGCFGTLAMAQQSATPACQPAACHAATSASASTADAQDAPAAKAQCQGQSTTTATLPTFRWVSFNSPA
ncbi:MAG: hypothetical protein KDC54_11425, partial [Lewinella sp.]|nr:hypothetical protein [Lewinella sp.]